MGGVDHKESAKLILHQWLEKEVAILYSHQGKGKLKKKALNNTAIYNVFKGIFLFVK